MKVLLILGFEIEEMDKLGEYIITRPMLTNDNKFIMYNETNTKDIQLKVVPWVRHPAPRIGIVEMMFSSAKITDGIRTPVKSSGYMETLIKDGIDFEVGTLRGNQGLGIGIF